MKIRPLLKILKVCDWKNKLYTIIQKLIKHTGQVLNAKLKCQWKLVKGLMYATENIEFEV